MTKRTNYPGYLVILITLGCFILIGLDRTGQVVVLRPLTTELYQWVIVLSAIGLLLGIINAIWIHINRIQTGQPDWALSLALLASLLVVFAAGLVDSEGAAGLMVEWFFDTLIAPIQTALFALLVFFLAAAAYRFLHINRTGGTWMLMGALIMFGTQLPISQDFLGIQIQPSVNWLIDQPVMAAMRGALLGSSLAILVIGLRFLTGRQ